MNLDKVWKKENNLVPAIIQDANNKNILMLGYMTRESYLKTIETKKVTFFSRSRQCLWTKGETSGNYLNYVSSEIDCDNDTLLVQAINKGPTCHLEKYSCFGDEIFSFYKLQTIINDRKEQKTNSSYTSYLLNEGNKEIVKKIAEEANELAISVVSNDGRLLDEAADLMYHLQVLLVANDLSLNDLEQALSKRNK